MSITAEDINYLIFRYLQESGADTQKTRMPMIANQVETEAQCAGMIHTAYAFEIESQVGKADVAHEDIDNGCLIKLLQRGLQYMELEANADSSTFEVLTAADILKAKSTEQLKSVVREKREERDNSDEQPAPRQFEEDACRIVTTAEAFSASWNPEGTKLATYVHENTAQIWTAGTTMEYKILEPMSACPLVHGPKTDSLESVIVTRLIWAPDGQNVTTGCSDGTICTWSSSGELFAILILTLTRSPSRLLHPVCLVLFKLSCNGIDTCHMIVTVLSAQGTSGKHVKCTQTRFRI